jgi:tripartite-type tricarboxylate transporter receptor subunit TctC
MIRRHLLLAAAVCGLLGAATAHAQRGGEYPSRTARIIVPFATGGSTDILARSVAGILTRELGQTFVVENRPGASGNIGAEAVAKAPADGYTLLFTTTNLTLNPAVTKVLPYDAEADFAPVTMVAFAPMILIKGPAVKANSLPELIAEIRAQPGKFNYSSSGKGGAPHLAGELFRMGANLDIVHVPYNGAAPALTDVASGQVQLTFTTYISAKPLMSGKNVAALAVANKERLAALPDVPTFEELGVKGVEIGTMFGLLAPARTPSAVVQRLHAVLAKAAATPEFRAQIAEQGGNVVLNTPREYAAYIQSDVARWKTLIARIGGAE